MFESWHEPGVFGALLVIFLHLLETYLRNLVTHLLGSCSNCPICKEI